MASTNKKNYTAPQLKVVEFMVENGFQSSLEIRSPQATDGGDVPGQTETFGRTTFEGWND